MPFEFLIPLAVRWLLGFPFLTIDWSMTLNVFPFYLFLFLIDLSAGLPCHLSLEGCASP